MGNAASTFSARINAAVAERADVSQSLCALYDHSHASTAHCCTTPFSVFFFYLNCDAIRNSHLTAWVTSVSVEAECKQCEPFRPGLQQILRLGHAAIDHNHSCSESMTCCEHLSKLLSLIVTNEKKATFLHKSWGQSKPSNSLHAAKENKKIKKA